MTSSPWTRLAESSSATDDLADVLEAIVERVSVELARGEEDPADPSVKVATARDLSAASARLRHAAMALQVLSAGLVDDLRVHRHDSERTTRTWLARHNGLSGRDAALLCRAATARERFPLVSQAFLAGELTLGHLSAVGDIIPSRFSGEALDQAVEAAREIQPTLIESAKENTVDDFARLCARVRDRLDTDGPGDPSQEPSRIWLSRLFNGRWALSGDLSADDGPVIASLLSDALARAEAAAQFAPAAPETPAPAPAADDAPAAPDAPAAASVETAAPTQSAQQATALLDLLLAGAGAGRPGRVGLFVHIDVDRFELPSDPSLAALFDPHTAAHTEAGLDITDDSLWAMMSGADVTPIFNRNGAPLSFGRTRRLAPDILRRALAHRDRRCRATGCGAATNRSQAHHVVHWDDGGPTSPENCANACGFHHKGHHRHGYRISGNANGVLTITRPDGQVVDGWPLYRKRSSGER